MKTIKTTLLLLAALPFAAHAGTGWTNTAGGTLRFLDPDNWDEGDVNGVFPAEWTPAAATTIQLTNDWTGSLSFLGSIAKDTTFTGRNAQNSRDESRTITLDGDLLVRPAASAGRLVFNSTVELNLGGVERTFELYSPSSADKFRVNSPISNGDLVLAGNGAGMTLVGAAAVAGDVSICPNTTLAMNWATAGSTVRRTDDIKLRRATLSVAAYRGNDTAEFGPLTVSGRDAPGVSVLSITPGNYVATVRAESFAIKDGGTLAVMATSLAADATSSSRLVFDSAPALAGDAGAAGTPGVAVLPGVVVGTAANALPTGTINNSENYNGLFLATYDSTFGVRRLAAAETVTDVSASEAVNLVVNAGTPLALDADAEVNSLQLQATKYRDAVPSISGDGKLTVKSGMVLATAVKSGATIGVALDFGETTGRIVAAGPTGEQVSLSKPVYGSAGLVISKGLLPSWDTVVTPSSSARGFAISTSADEGTYTGDTWIQSIVSLGSSPFLPHGARSGDTIVNGTLDFGSIAVNGLRGSGLVRGTTLTVGEDGSDGDFSGTMTVTTVNKVGAGTQRLAGAATGTLNANAGTLLVDGTLTGSANVADGGAIGGSGEISEDLAFAEGGALAVSIADNAAPCLSVAGAVTGSAQVTVSAADRVRDDFSACILRSGSALPATFRCATKGYRLELRNGDTELWLGKNPTVTILIVK